MSRTRRGRRALAALAAFLVTSALVSLYRSGSAEQVQALSEADLANATVVTEWVVLRWTAPGDDGLNGRATRYDLRYSTSAIVGGDTLGWWNRASVVPLWNKIPALPGKPDSVRVLGFQPGYRYYAMLRTCDEVPNWSPYSNLAIIEAADLQPPSAVANLRVR